MNRLKLFYPCGLPPSWRQFTILQSIEAVITNLLFGIHTSESAGLATNACNLLDLTRGVKN